MKFREVDLEEIKHEHPLILIDLQLLHQDYVEDDEDVEDDDLLNFQKFKCKCVICGFGIDWYHRYYYKCKEHLSCNYSIHKLCAEMATTLRFPAHPDHILNLKKALTLSGEWKCHSCLEIHQLGMFCYVCSTCDYVIDLHCATFMERNTIHHPSHPHPLTSVSLDPILSTCCACGKNHEGRFYHCTTCFNFSIHTDCVSLPFKILLENEHFSHTHMLTLSYSSTVIPFGFKCRICRQKIVKKSWLYKCTKCHYYVHVGCATSWEKALASMLSSGLRKRYKNFRDSDYPNLLNFPLPDEPYSILSHVSREQNYRHCEQIVDENGYLKHSSHEHPLVLIDTESTSTSRMPLLHDPMKRIKVLCDGCVRPITRMPFYKCNEWGCDFYLHEGCTRLPTQLEHHPVHPQHTLFLFLKPTESWQWFLCHTCLLDCNGFGYACSECYYHIDVNCGLVPEQITHEAHSNHLLSRSTTIPTTMYLECDACHGTIGSRSRIYFRCNACDFNLDSQCALHLPKAIRNKYDHHSLELSYTPIENHSGQYLCEVCEEFLNPNSWFYHCSECSQSIHSACAPFILKSEQGVGTEDLGGISHVMNMKFGGLKKVQLHQHPLSFVVGTESDGKCSFCGITLQSCFIFKCLQQCKFALHCTPCLYPKQSFYPLSGYANTMRLLEQKKSELQLQTSIAFYPNGFTRPGS